MSSATLLAGAALSGLTAVLFAYVGRLNLHRATHDEDTRRAMRQFGYWWLGLSAYTLLIAVGAFLAASGNLDVRAHVLLMATGYAPLAVALWGLLSYLVYIYSGTHRWQAGLRAYHLALCAGLLLLLLYTRPTRILATDWGTLVEYERPVTGWVLASIVLAILGPVLVGALAYGGLYTRTRDPVARRRVLMVSSALILWFGLSAAATALDVRAAWWPLAARILALCATGLLVAAYWRPAHPDAPLAQAA